MFRQDEEALDVTSDRAPNISPLEFKRISAELGDIAHATPAFHSRQEALALIAKLNAAYSAAGNDAVKALTLTAMQDVIGELKLDEASGLIRSDRNEKGRDDRLSALDLSADGDDDDDIADALNNLSADSKGGPIAAAFVASKAQQTKRRHDEPKLANALVEPRLTNEDRADVLLDMARTSPVAGIRMSALDAVEQGVENYGATDKQIGALAMLGTKSSDAKVKQRAMGLLDSIARSFSPMLSPRSMPVPRHPEPHLTWVNPLNLDDN